MAGIELIRQILSQATAKGTKATVLKPLGWMMALTMTGTMGAFASDTPRWIGIMFGIFAALTMALYLVAYLYCLFKDRNALRSETYLIQKLAIEKGYVGDDRSGLIRRVDDLGKILGPSTTANEETQK